MRKCKWIFLFVFYISFTNIAIAQDSLIIKTLDKSRALLNNKKFTEAAEILGSFEDQYPGNIWIERLYAQTLFWMHDYVHAERIYERAIGFHPDDMDIKYEYAIMLFDRGKYGRTKELLTIYTDNYQQNAGAESLLGITDYYLGEFKDSEQHLEKALKLSPGDKKTFEIYQQVLRIVKPWVKASLAFTDDSQPLKVWLPALDAGWYRSHFLNLTFLLNFQNFSSDTIHTNRVNFQLQNSFLLPKAGFSAKLSAGAFYVSANQSYDYTWGVSLQQKVAKYLFIRTSGERSAYTYTLSSLTSPFSRNRYSFSLTWEKSKSWNAKAGYIGEYFPDTNNIQTYYAWALSPTIAFSVFELSFGYGFNYSNAKESRYVPEQSLEDIINNYQSDSKITGIYDPYFTPNNQFANSALANINIIPSQNIIIKLHAAVGFYARAMNSYFYLDNNKNGMTTIREGFYQESYTPLDLGINFDADLSAKIILNASYTYLQTFYFNSNNFLVSLKIYF